MATSDADLPSDVAALDELLARPTPGTGADLATALGDRRDVLVLGAGGKMGPSLSWMAARALREAGRDDRVIAVSRFGGGSSPAAEWLREREVDVLAGDLGDPHFVGSLPEAGVVLFMVGLKFGTADRPASTWRANTVVPGLVAQRFLGSSARIVVFSSGNIYPFMPTDGPGANEATPVDPVGEYAWSVLGRERVFESYAEEGSLQTLAYRLNYAVEPRYGVLVDLALAVWEERPIDLSMGFVNVLWQRDANAVALRCATLAESPQRALNVTGPQMLSVQWLATELGRRLGKAVQFRGDAATSALLNDASDCWRRYAAPTLAIDGLLDLTANWVRQGLPLLGKPTQFQVRDGDFS